VIRLFHASDLHFGAADAQALTWFRDLVERDRPDGIIITGDITMRARRREFTAATAYLQTLTAPIRLEPGNHDLPYFNPMMRMLRPYRRFQQLADRHPIDGWDQRVVMVGLRTTARVQWRLNWSKGRVAASPLRAATAALRSAPADAARLVLCHHPLADPATIGTARTRGGRAALDALAAAGADAVLSGHVHDPFDRTLRIGSATIRMIGAGTLSERIRETPPSFN